MDRQEHHSIVFRNVSASYSSATPGFVLASGCIEWAGFRPGALTFPPSAPTTSSFSMTGAESVEDVDELVPSVLIVLCFLGGSANVERQTAESSPASRAFNIVGTIMER